MGEPILDVRPADARYATAAPRCPYCHDAIPLEGRVWVACECCLARHHLACWRSAKGCGTCGRTVALVREGGKAATLRDWSRRKERRESRALVALVGAVVVSLVAATVTFFVHRSPRVIISRGAPVDVQQRRALQSCCWSLGEAGHVKLAERLSRWDRLEWRDRRDLRYDLGKLVERLSLASTLASRPSGDRELLHSLQLDLTDALETH